VQRLPPASGGKATEGSRSCSTRGAAPARPTTQRLARPAGGRSAAGRGARRFWPSRRSSDSRPDEVIGSRLRWPTPYECLRNQGKLHLVRRDHQPSFPPSPTNDNFSPMDTAFPDQSHCQRTHWNRRRVLMGGQWIDHGRVMPVSALGEPLVGDNPYRNFIAILLAPPGP
jgi:hypothetical protein